MTPDIPEMFATVTGLLEDMHDVAVEGKVSDNPHELQQGLVACLATSIGTLQAAITSIGSALNEA